MIRLFRKVIARWRGWRARRAYDRFVKIVHEDGRKEMVKIRR